MGAHEIIRRGAPKNQRGLHQTIEVSTSNDQIECTNDQKMHTKQHERARRKFAFRKDPPNVSIQRGGTKRSERAHKSHALKEGAPEWEMNALSER